VIDREELGKLIGLLRAIVRTGVVDLTVSSSNGDTLATVLRASSNSVQHIEQQLACIAELASSHSLPLTPADCAVSALSKQT
jgi:hypothetical protein